MVKAALEEAEKAQNAAEKAIKQADEDIKGTQDLLTSVSYFLISKCFFFSLLRYRKSNTSETDVRVSRQGSWVLQIKDCT